MASLEPDEPANTATLPSENNMSTQSLLSGAGSEYALLQPPNSNWMRLSPSSYQLFLAAGVGGSGHPCDPTLILSVNCVGYESQYGSLFGSRFSLTDGSGIYVSSLALTIMISALAVVAIVLVTVIITLAVMLSSCEQQHNSSLNFVSPRVHTFCSSFQLNLEMNNLQEQAVPSLCRDHVFGYVHGGQYLKDFEAAVDSARRYLNTLVIDRDAKYTVVLDIDETALSNVLYNVNSIENFVDHIWGISMNKSEPSPMVPLLNLYRELRAANWSIVFLSERPDSTWNATLQNLVAAGYEGWTSLILRSLDEADLTVQEYKSSKRAQLEKQGYQIKSVLGDQWSDIIGPATGARTFKLPNPMYQIL